MLLIAMSMLDFFFVFSCINMFPFIIVWVCLLYIFCRYALASLSTAALTYIFDSFFFLCVFLFFYVFNQSNRAFFISKLFAFIVSIFVIFFANFITIISCFYIYITFAVHSILYNMFSC